MDWYYISLTAMSGEVSPSVLQILENYSGKKVRVILDRNLGFEGVIVTVSSNPPGIWLSETEAIVVRSTTVKKEAKFSLI